MLETTTYIDTRYPECDRAGIIHHAVYPIWYEMARMEFFEKMGFSFTDMDKLGVNPVVVDLHLQYKAMATYPQRVRITTRIGQYGARKLELVYACYAEDRDEPINTATSFHVWTGPDMKTYNLEENLPEVYAKVAAAAE